MPDPTHTQPDHHPHIDTQGQEAVGRWKRQTKRGGGHAPPEERGDCVAACLASILGVPHPGVLTNFHGDGWWDRMQAELASHDYCVALLDVRYDPPPCYWIASVPSSLPLDPDGKKALHCIVCRGHEFIHDPAELYDQARWVQAWNADEVAEGWLLVPLDPAREADADAARSYRALMTALREKPEPSDA